MPKRRAGVKNIIYELDEHDTGSDSSVEGRVSASAPQARARAKRNRGAAVRAAAHRLASIKRAHAVDADCVEVIDLESSGVIDIDSSDRDDGGKLTIEPAATQIEGHEEPAAAENQRKLIKEDEINASNNVSRCSSPPDPNLSMNILDSVESDEEGDAVVGCENRSPLVTIKFRDKRVARHCKEKLKDFIVAILKSLEENSAALSDTESDLQQDVWPEDVLTDIGPGTDGPESDVALRVEGQPEDGPETDIALMDEGEMEDGPETDVALRDEVETEDSQDDSALFFVDTNPYSEKNDMNDIPQYCQSGDVLTDGKQRLSSPPRAMRSQTCFNCDGNHQLRECPLPKNGIRIAQRRKAMIRVGRYHVEDEQKFGHLVPGRISGRLRHALGLKREELPLHIYRMRLLGYPPGWLQEARISHSGITMFDSQGQAIQDPEEEEGEVCAPGSKDKFDIKKILDFPGFNVPPSSRYKEVAHKYGLPPMSEHDSKLLMLASLAPNAMQAYKRKKLTLFPFAAKSSPLQGGTADMELDSDGETSVEFPSVPPLPDDAPPPPPPPPQLPPLPPPPEVPPPPPPEEVPPMPPPEDIPSPVTEKQDPDIANVNDIEEKSQSSSGRSSPSLMALEEHKRMLLEALEISETPGSPSQGSGRLITAAENSKTEVTSTPKTDVKMHNSRDDTPEPSKAVPNEKLHCTVNANMETPKPGKAAANKETLLSTPGTGGVKSSDFGTPVVNIASPYLKLPSDVKFAKDICDIINFENLPDSTGTYKKMSTLLKKVKDEVMKIQDS